MVYVDPAVHPYRGMLMCHMIADTREELIAMAKHVGVKTRYIQFPGTPKEHFDICKSKRAIAVKAGAIELTWKEIGGKIKNKRVK